MALLVSAAALLLASLPVVQASHVLYATLDWTPGGGTLVFFELTLGLRVSRFNHNFGTMRIGDTVQGIGSLEFGDMRLVPVILQVELVDFEADWFKGTFKTSHSYTEVGGAFTAKYSSCCWYGFLVDNSLYPFLISTKVNLARRGLAFNTPPTVAINIPVPVVFHAGVANETFLIRALDADRDTISFRFATPEEMGHPLARQPQGLTLDEGTGLLTWSAPAVTTYLGKYLNVLIVIQDSRQTMTQVAFVMKVQPPEFAYCRGCVSFGVVRDLDRCRNSGDCAMCSGGCNTNQPPIFIAPTPTEPLCHVAGQPNYFTMAAIDDDLNDLVNIVGINLPAGVQTVQAKPFDNPTSLQVQWIPPPELEGSDTEMCFIAYDASRRSTAVRCVVLSVPLGRICEQLKFAVQPRAVMVAGQDALPAPKVSVHSVVSGNSLISTSTRNVTLQLSQCGTIRGSLLLLGDSEAVIQKGVAVFSRLRITKMTTPKSDCSYFQLRAEAAGAWAALSEPFQVLAGTPARVRLVDFPYTARLGAVAGVPWPPISAILLDDFENLVATVRNSTHFTTSTANLRLHRVESGLTDVSERVMGDRNASIELGQFVFANLRVNVAEVYRLEVACSPLKSGFSDDFTLKAGSATKLEFTQQPVTLAMAGLGLGHIVITVRDYYGNHVLSAEPLISLRLKGKGVGSRQPPLFGDTSFAAVRGRAEPSLFVTRAGVGFKLEAISAGLGIGVSSEFSVVPQQSIVGSPFRLRFKQQPFSAVTAGELIGIAVIQAEDRYGNLDRNYSSATACALVHGATAEQLVTSPLDGTVVQADTGQAIFLNVTVQDARKHLILVAIPTPPLGVSQVGFSHLIQVAAATPALLSFAVHPPSLSVAGKVLSRTPVVQIQDRFGNFVSGASEPIALALVRSHKSSFDGEETQPYLQGQSYRTATEGQAEFADLSIWLAAQYQFYAWSQRLQSTWSTPVIIVHAELRRIAFVYPTSTPVLAVAGIPIFPSVRLQMLDGWGNLVVSPIKDALTLTVDDPAFGAVLQVLSPFYPLRCSTCVDP